jgi:putative oxidoreductase
LRLACSWHAQGTTPKERCRSFTTEVAVLVRRIARPLLASTFIYGGIDALRHPEAKAPRAEKLDIPSKPGMATLRITTAEQAVRSNAAVQVTAGTLLSLNKFPRLAALALAVSLVPTTLAGHPFWEESERDQKIFHLTHFFKNLSMLGGLLIASVDSGGKESLAHKTKRVSDRTRRKAAKDTARAAARVARKAGKKQAAASDRLHDLLPG